MLSVPSISVRASVGGHVCVALLTVALVHLACLCSFVSGVYLGCLAQPQFVFVASCLSNFLLLLGLCVLCHPLCVVLCALLIRGHLTCM